LKSTGVCVKTTSIRTVIYMESVGTKIIATVGPACSNLETLHALVKAGADGFRINCSHTKPGEISTLVKLLKTAGAGFIIADLQGPKLRILEPVKARAGDRVIFGEGGVKLSHKVFKVGSGVVSFKDGSIFGNLLGVKDGGYEIEFTGGADLPKGSAIHLPGAVLEGGCVGEKDEADLEEAVSAGVEWVALSYVSDAEDAKKGYDLVNKRCGVIAKIEKASALEDLRNINKVVDAVMIARGDLGVELDYSKVPSAQREIFNQCRKDGVPVVCATEMLGSMVSEPRPTRAEVGDVEGVVRNEYDALVLTAETAMGKDPVAVVRAAARIREVAEDERRSTTDGTRLLNNRRVFENRGDTVLASAAVEVADSIKAEAIVALTSTGHTAKLVARARPRTMVYAVSFNPEVARRAGLYYGVVPMLETRGATIEESSDLVLKKLKKSGKIKTGDTVVFIGSRTGPEQDADVVMIRTVSSKH
jgi:pyruvate kinase